MLTTRFLNFCRPWVVLDIGKTGFLQSAQSLMHLATAGALVRKDSMGFMAYLRAYIRTS